MMIQGIVITLDYIQDTLLQLYIAYLSYTLERKQKNKLS